jgi:hypothetical protein
MATSRNPSPSPRTGKTYRVGSSGLKVTWRDGSVTTFQPQSVVTFSAVPLRIEGRLYRTTRSERLGYEAPALEPSR